MAGAITAVSDLTKRYGAKRFRTEIDQAEHVLDQVRLMPGITARAYAATVVDQLGAAHPLRISARGPRRGIAEMSPEAANS